MKPYGPIDDVDALLVIMIEEGEAIRPWHGAEAIAVKAIVRLSRAGRLCRSKSIQAWARELMAELLFDRGAAGSKLDPHECPYPATCLRDGPHQTPEPRQ